MQMSRMLMLVTHLIGALMRVCWNEWNGEIIHPLVVESWVDSFNSEVSLSNQFKPIENGGSEGGGGKEEEEGGAMGGYLEESRKNPQRVGA